MTFYGLFIMDNNAIIVGIGDFKIGEAPSVIKTTLGSCIAVCLYDASKKIGGLLHIMMPDSNAYRGKNIINRAKYADTGIVDMVDSLKKEYNTSEISLKAKIFGGAKILKMAAQNIGEDNEEAVRVVLESLKIPIIASKTRGDKGYQVEFVLETGKVNCRVFGENAGEY